MPVPKTSFFYSNSNYLSTAENQNLSLIGGSIKLGKQSMLSVSAGAEQKMDFNKQSCSYNPAFEAKLKTNIGKHFNTQVRFREIGGTEQLRVTFGGGYKLDDNNSFYGAGHITTKNNFGNLKTNTGFWFGYTHTFDDGASVSLEAQQNIPVNSSTGCLNTLGSFDDGNKLFNILLNIPLKNKQKTPKVVEQ